VESQYFHCGCGHHSLHLCRGKKGGGEREGKRGRERVGIRRREQDISHNKSILLVINTHMYMYMYMYKYMYIVLV
jgi:hypothetical protein